VAPDTFDPMRDAWIKHNRALRHINELNAECAKFLNGDPRPYLITVDYETDASCHVARFVEVKAPGPEVGAIVGDIAHNLRSALDVTAWQLAIEHDRKAAKANRRRITYPLTSDERAFMRHDLLPYISDRALAVIESLQPYERGDRDHLQALGWLSKVSNADKHRIATGTFASVGFGTVLYVPEGDYSFVIKYVGTMGVDIESGTPIAHIEVDGPPQTKVRVKGEPTLQVRFDAGSGHLGAMGVMAMFSAVEYSLTQLGAAFKPPA
jgi:hypothetical protein